MMLKLVSNRCIQALLALVFCFSLQAQKQQEIIGKWDLNVQGQDRIVPSWLEVKQSGVSTLVGYFVEYNGSARPISEVKFHEGIVDFSIPPQWNGYNDLHFTARLNEGKLEGTILGSDGKTYPFTGERAPKLIRDKKIAWGKSATLLNGTDLQGWKAL